MNISNPSIQSGRRRAQSAMTLVEVMFASAISTVVIAIVMILVVFAVGACVHKPSSCPNLNIRDVAPAMGAGVAIQPVFTASTVKGWRIYNVRNSDQLKAQSIADGTMLTHVCGVPAGEIHANGGAICCSTDASREFEVTFDIAGQARKFMLRRP